MKLTLFITVIACLQVSANNIYSQTISFSGKDVPLTTVFASIEKQTGLSFFFNSALIKDAKPVSPDWKNVALDRALQEILAGQGLDYYTAGKTIFIVKKEVVITKHDGIDRTAVEKAVDIKGRVTNQQGESLVGATVSVRNGNKITLTDEKGMFELKGVPQGATLEVTYSGYQRKEVPVSNEIIRVEMLLASNKLDEVKVIAYGNTTERFSVGNETSVKAKDIEKQPVGNVLATLEGRVPGLFVTQTNGLPGGGITVRVQGQNSVNNGNDPLYVVDGVPYSSQTLPTVQASGILGGSGGSGTVGSGNGNPLSYINPSDIESIDVLKDAAATAIYGSRAANGAILITTKRGKVGVTKTDIDVQEGWGKVAHKINMLNTQQYLAMRHEAKRNDNAAVLSTDYDINGLWDSTRSTDWQKTLLGGTDQYTNVNASISGGATATQFLVGGTYHRETTVFPGSFADQKGGLHFNINNTSSNQRFKLQFSGSYLVDNNRLPNADLAGNSVLLAPDAPKLHNADGSLNWAPTASGTSSWTNPLAVLNNTYQNKTNNLISNSILSYRILRGLDIKSSFGYTNLQTNEYVAYPLTYYAPENRLNTARSALYTNSALNSWIIEPQLNYRKSIGLGKLDVLAGTTINQNNGSGYYLKGSGFNSDNVLKDIRSAATITANNSVNFVYRYNALFGKVGYNWDDKYIIELTARRDGSSSFGSKNQFHDFGAVGVAWIFSQEDLFKKGFPFISYGKVRGSYGLTGNDQIGNYKFMNLYTPITVGVAYQGATGLNVQGLSNPSLEWEQTKKESIGVDLGFFKDKVLVSGSYSRNRSSNQLLSYSLPLITGFGSVPENFPATVQNTTWEFSVTVSGIKTRDFSWSCGLNFTLPRNRLIAFPNLATSPYASSLVIGQPLGVVKAYKYVGVDPTSGVYAFGDSHGNAVFEPNFPNDMTVMINTLPKIYGGFENSFTYKGITIDLMFQFVKQTSYDMSRFGFSNPPGYKLLNQPTIVLSRWQKPGDISPIQQYNSNLNLSDPFGNATSSNAAYVDGSYARLKNVSLSYRFPDKMVNGAHLHDLRLFAQGQNVLTFTKFRGLDPESQGLVTPPLRVITIGVHVGL
jgi:TonB-linked SusC/RagA family outer membrane protein